MYAILLSLHMENIRDEQNFMKNFFYFLFFWCLVRNELLKVVSKPLKRKMTLKIHTYVTFIVALYTFKPRNKTIFL